VSASTALALSASSRSVRHDSDLHVLREIHDLLNESLGEQRPHRSFPLSDHEAMRMGPRVLVSESRAMLMRLMVINHLVHHRAQLGVYLRLLNVPIPGMYGPSADEPV